MSECETLRRKLAALLAGAVPAPEEFAARAHLAECADCARELENWWRLARGLERLPAPPLEPATLERIAAAATAHRIELLERRWNRLVLAGLVAYGWALFLVIWPFLPALLDWVSVQLALPRIAVIIFGLGCWWSFCLVIGLALLPLLRNQRIDLEEKVL